MPGSLREGARQVRDIPRKEGAVAQGICERVWDAPEIYRVRLPFSNLKKAESNCYIVKAGKESLIVDTGANTPEGRTRLLDALSDSGVDFASATLFLTHLHFDHAELTGSCIPAGARIVASEEGVASRMPEARAAIQREFYRRMRGHGAFARDASDYAECNAETAFLDPAAYDMRYAAAGDEVRVGGMAFQVLEIPGHTPDSLALYQPDTRLLFCGDAVLPDSTPSVDAFPGSRDGYGLFLGSLDALRPLPVACALPGHGGPLSGPSFTARIDAIAAKKAAKCEAMLNLIVDYPDETGEALARRTAGADRGRWCALSRISRYYAMLESFVLIQHLVLTGQVERIADFERGAYRYRIL